MGDTQNDRILAILRRNGNGGITPIEALNEVGCFRLAAAIFVIKRDLLRDDEEVVNVGYSTPTGKHVARYVLRPKVGHTQAEPMSIWGGDV